MEQGCTMCLAKVIAFISHNPKIKKHNLFFFPFFPIINVVLTKIPFEKNAKVQMLGSDKKLSWKKTSQGIEINIPASLKKSGNYVWVLKVQS